MLSRCYSLELSPVAPFNFDATLHDPSHFPTGDLEWQPGTLWRTMLWEGRPLGLKFENQGTVARPRLALSVWSGRELSPAFLERLAREIVYRYSLDLDLADFNAKAHRDPVLGPIALKWRGMRSCNHSSLYEYLIIAILLQNATVRRSVQMMEALFERYGTRLQFDGKSLHCFWPAQKLVQVTEEELRTLKVGYRARSIKRITQAFAAGDLDEFELREQTYEEQRGALMRLYGVGPASAGYILSDVFHHLDELRHISPWEQKIYSKLFFDREPSDPVPEQELLRFFEERYSRYKMLAVHYVWADLWWKRRNERIDWLEDLIRL